MRRKLATLYRELKQCIQWVGVPETSFYLFCKLSSVKVLRQMSFQGTSVYIRTGTPDLAVASSTLVDQEYKNVEIADPSVIIDAGAHIGTSAIYFSHKYPEARIFAIEPEKENYELLIKNTASYPNIVPIQAGLWSEVETRTIQDRFTGQWGYTLSNTHNKTQSTGQEIHCITIDSLMSQYNLEHVDILKIDIEGSEKEVLDHSASWIQKVSVITAELHDRICVGCEAAFQEATKDFARFDRRGEKVTAYRV